MTASALTRAILAPKSLALGGSVASIIHEGAAALLPLQPAMVLAFVPDGEAVAAISAGLSAHLGKGCEVLTCSSAGGFSFGGYDDDKTILIAFPSAHFRTKTLWLENLDQTPVMEWMRAFRSLESLPKAPHFPNQFGLLLIDGTSGREELVTATCEATIPSLMVVGGSAADGLRFERTHLALNGEERPASGLFCHVSTNFEIEEIILDHFTPEGPKIVVTEGDPEARMIYELNAEPAAVEYARLIGVDPQDLSPAIFAAHPLIETMGGRHFVRAIRGHTAEGALSLMSSIETGMILGVGRADSLGASLARKLETVSPAELILGFDCILRRIAVEEDGEVARVAELYARHRVAGFATYGEQHGGFHVNQTFVGLAFRKPAGHPVDAEAEGV